jgi:polyhydroxyalkanoate synthase subunit PhaC
MDDVIRGLLGPLQYGLVQYGLEQGDRIRQARGRWLDALGFGPMESPSRVVRSWPGAELRAYGDTGRASRSRSAAVLLIVPAPIKQAYIWDLAPEVSAVRRALEVGLRVYLIRWTERERKTAERDEGLAAYADRMIAESLDAITADSGGGAPIPTVLAGHSLGGTLAAIFAALHPRAVRALVLLEAPLRFGGSAAGAFAPLVRRAPPAEAVVAALGGRVPGSFLNLVSTAAAPDAFQWERSWDAATSLPDPAALRLHFRVERWTLDEFPLPGQLFVEVVEHLYREDRFWRGTLRLDGRIAAPARITAPVLAVFDSRSRVIPPASIVPFVEALSAHTDARALRYEGDAGVALQHVGVLVGRNAHRRLWPSILDWIRQHSRNLAERSKP